MDDRVVNRVAGGTPTRLWQLLRGVAVSAVVLPIRDGRIRDTRWPYGLRSVVLVAYLAFAAAGLLVVTSGLLRRSSDLVVSGADSPALPASVVWVLATLFSFGLSLLLTAALHGPWWLRLLALLVVLSALAAWSLRTPGISGSIVWTLAVLLLLVALVVLVVVRSRRAYAWWEIAAIWALVSLGVVGGLAENHHAIDFGGDFSPVLLQYFAMALGALVLPTAIAAGASVAEVCVRLTVAVTLQAERLPRRWAPYAVLGLVVVVRLVQVVRQLRTWNAVTDGWDVMLPAIGLAVLLGAVGVGVSTVSGRQGSRADVDRLADEIGAVALPVGAVLVGVNYPLQLVTGLVPVLALVDPGGTVMSSRVDAADLVGSLTYAIRAVVGIVVVGFAFRAARRGRATRALVLATSGVVLIWLAQPLVTGPESRGGIDADLLNLVGTAVVGLACGVELLRRRLTRERAIRLAAALTLCALFSGRDFVSDPVGAVLGFSGAALVLFGLTWDLFTGSGWANGESRRFARPTRVLLTLSSSVLTMSVLAYAALVRDGSRTIYLDLYAELGDTIFGTALLAAAVVAVLARESSDPTSAEPGSAYASSVGPITR